MKHKTYMQLTTAIFAVIGLLHLYRAFNGLNAMVGTLQIPANWSWVAAAVGLYLAYTGYKHSKRA